MTPRMEKHQKAQHKLADKVLAAALGKHKRAYFALPREFQKHGAYVRITVNGKRFYLYFAKSQPTCDAEVPVTGPLIAECEQHMADDAKIKSDKDALAAQTRSVVYAATTVKNLRELWPDGAKYYDKVLIMPAKLPVSVQALEKKITEVRS